MQERIIWINAILEKPPIDKPVALYVDDGTIVIGWYAGDDEWLSNDDSTDPEYWGIQYWAYIKGPDND